VRTVLIALAALVAVCSAGASTSAAPARVAFTAVPEAGSSGVVTVSADGSDIENLTPGSAAAERDPSLSPDGTQLVFDGVAGAGPTLTTQLYLVDADGSDRRQLTSGQVSSLEPHWSPRGDLIAFLRTSTNADYDLWVVRPDGSGLRQLTFDGHGKGNVSWSPGGSRILYTRDDVSGSTVDSVGLDGAPPRVLASASLGASASWSPDGSRVAFTGPGLSVMNADGSDAHQIVDLNASSTAWSPDGSRIAFTATRIFLQDGGGKFGPPGREDVFVVRADGTGLRRLTGPFADDRLAGPGGSQPTWWPDGSRLFYESERYPDEATTFQMNADGTCQQRFDPAAPVLVGPVWQPVAGPFPPVIRCAELRVYVDVGKSPVGLNEEAPWTVTVENDGNLTATDVNVSLGATQGSLTIFTTGTGECSMPSGIVECTGGSLGPGQTEQVTGTVSRRDAGPIRLHAAVLSDQLDTDLTDNTASAGVTVLPCTIVGTYGNDVLRGTAGPDRICGLAGADTIYGGAGNDFIDAGNGNDRIYPGPGRDTVLARGGNDVIYARDGQRDWIDCGAQHDIAIVDRVDVTRHCEVVIRPAR